MLRNYCVPTRLHKISTKKMSGGKDGKLQVECHLECLSKNQPACDRMMLEQHARNSLLKSKAFVKFLSA